LITGALDNIENPIAKGFCPVDQLAGIGSGSICPNEIEPRKPPGDSHHDQLGPITILNDRFTDDYCKQKIQSINRDMLLSTIDLFAGIVAARAACFCSLHALTVKNSGTGTYLALRIFSHFVT